jgi:hypothetical protein
MLSCPSVTLDKFCLSHRPPTLIKIDVEGGELEVLRGAREALVHHKPVLVIELHDEDRISAMYNFLVPLGYVLEVIGVRRGGDGRLVSRYLANLNGAVTNESGR